MDQESVAVLYPVTSPLLTKPKPESRRKIVSTFTTDNSNIDITYSLLGNFVV